MNARPLFFLVILVFAISCHDKDFKNKTVLDKVINVSFGETDQYVYRSDGTLLRCDVYVAERVYTHLDYTYDNGKITLVKEYWLDALFRTTSFIYDVDNNLSEVHIVRNDENDAENILKITWANNQIQKIEDLSENVSTSLEYDSRNNATKITLVDTNSSITTNIFERIYDDHLNPLYGIGDPLDYFDLPSSVPIFPNNFTSEISKDGNGTIYSNAEIKYTYNKEGLVVKSVYNATAPNSDPAEEVITEYVYKKI
jgi:hypothetical protein